MTRIVLGRYYSLMTTKEFWEILGKSSGFYTTGLGAMGFTGLGPRTQLSVPLSPETHK